MKKLSKQQLKKIKQEKYNNSIENAKLKYESNKLEHEKLTTIINIKDRTEQTHITHFSVLRLYTLLPLFQKVIINNIFPLYKDRLIDNLILTAELKHYKLPHCIRFTLEGNLNNNKGLYSGITHGEIIINKEYFNIENEQEIIRKLYLEPNKSACNIIELDIKHYI